MTTPVENRGCFAKKSAFLGQNGLIGDYRTVTRWESEPTRTM